MENKININEIKEKISDRLKESGWSKVLKSYIFSNDFEDSIKKLVTFVSQDQRFTPPLKNIFRAFEECPLNKLKVVVIGQDPYPQLNVADGISFSCSKTGKEQPSLRFIFNEIERTVYSPEIPQEDSMILREGYNPDLKRWSNQGVLMLNTTLTCEIGKIGSHYDVWKTFTSYLFDYLNSNHTGLIYIFMGRKSQEWSDLINDDLNYKINVKHPASGVYSKTGWDCNDMFNEVNKILKNNINETIIW